jgi:hypothetical protein
MQGVIMRGINKTVVRFGLVGAFALAMLSHAATARADSSAPGNYWDRAIASENAASLVMLPSTVRAARTPSKPVHVKPAISISTSAGTLKYLKSRHRDPVIVFVVKLSRAPGNAPLTVDYATAGSTILAESEFQSASGELTFRGSTLMHKIVVPVAALTTDPSNYLSLDLSDPTGGVIGNGQGVGLLVAKGHVR